MVIHHEIPADTQQSVRPQGEERAWWIFKIHTIVRPNRSAEIDALKSQRMLRGKKNVIHKEWKGRPSKILPPSPHSVTLSLSLSQSASPFFRCHDVTTYWDIENHWNMITSVESVFLFVFFFGFTLWQFYQLLTWNKWKNAEKCKLFWRISYVTIALRVV